MHENRSVGCIINVSFPIFRLLPIEILLGILETNISVPIPIVDDFKGLINVEENVVTPIT